MCVIKREKRECRVWPEQCPLFTHCTHTGQKYSKAISNNPCKWAAHAEASMCGRARGGHTCTHARCRVIRPCNEPRPAIQSAPLCFCPLHHQSSIINVIIHHRVFPLILRSSPSTVPEDRESGYYKCSMCATHMGKPRMRPWPRGRPRRSLDSRCTSSRRVTFVTRRELVHLLLSLRVCCFRRATPAIN